MVDDAGAGAGADAGDGVKADDGCESYPCVQRLGLMDLVDSSEGTCAGSPRTHPAHDCGRQAESIVGFALGRRIQ